MGEQRVCAVAGGTRGIGLAVVRRFLGAGYAVSVAGRQLDLVEQVGRANLQQTLLTQQLDLTSAGSGDRFIQHTVDRLGRVDVLVFCAAVAPLAKMDVITDDQFESTVDLNIRAMFYTVRAAWKQMQKQRGGTIVNISSMSAVDPFPGFNVYGASKAWCDLFSKAIADEGAEFGIRAFSIRPGAVETQMLRELFPDYPAEQTLSPEDVAALVWDVCQPSASYVNGQAIDINQ